MFSINYLKIAKKYVEMDQMVEMQSNFAIFCSECKTLLK